MSSYFFKKYSKKNTDADEKKNESQKAYTCCLNLVTLSCCSRRFTSLEQLTLTDCWMLLVLNSRKERLSTTSICKTTTKKGVTIFAIIKLKKLFKRYYLAFLLSTRGGKKIPNTAFWSIFQMVSFHLGPCFNYEVR